MFDAIQHITVVKKKKKKLHQVYIYEMKGISE